MIQSFLSSWALFYQSYVTGWLICLLLSIIGVSVVARDQIFIGAAVSQASTLGIALTMWAALVFHLEQYSWFQSDVFFSAMAVIFSILAASITARGGETGKESHEAITGWVFLISASLSILIVSHSPHGLEEIHRLLSSSIIGATATDIWSFSLLTFLTVLLILLLYRKILLFTLDPSMASAIGMKMKHLESGYLRLAGACCWTLDPGIRDALYLRMPCSARARGKESVPGSSAYVSCGTGRCYFGWNHRVCFGERL